MDAQKMKPIQDEYLGKVKANNKNVTIYLTSGLPIRGKIKEFDSYTIFVESEKRKILIYKHAISTVVEE